MSIVIEQASKIYGTAAVVDRVSLEIESGEFFVLIGPSGSGKSTLLRLIAGLTHMDDGRIVLHGRDVTDLMPQERGVGFVFQNYALFKHMSAAENIEYGLKVRRIPAAERRARVAELLELVGLGGLAERLPAQLSGGQQQRVSLARALAFNPEVLLLDEPFGALDAKIRVELRRSVRRIQREIGISAIFVTHDQEEAFALADRVGVMHDGALVECGPPEDLYQSPAHDFTATFLGSANLVLASATETGLRIGESTFAVPLDFEEPEPGRMVKVLIRPEDVAISRLGADHESRLVAEATVTERSFGGATERLRLTLKASRELQVLFPEPRFGSGEVQIESLRTRPQALAERVCAGETVWVSLRRIHCLEVLNSLPALGGRHALEFLARRRQSVSADADPAAEFSPGQAAARPGAEPMEIDLDKLLIWYGQPRSIQRIVVNLSDQVREDRDLVDFVRQTFSSGRPPSIELLYIQPIGAAVSKDLQDFMTAARREFLQLGTAVRTTIRIGDPLKELRGAVGQNDTDLLITDLPREAWEAQANGAISHWVLHHLGPVGTLFFLPSELVEQTTEEAA